MAGSGIAGVLLAAGAGARMGSPKQLLRFDGVSLVRRAARELQDSRCDSCFAVVGAHAPEVEAELAGMRIEAISNPAWQEGIGSSIRCALEGLAARGSFAAVLFTLADQPFVSHLEIDGLIDAFQAGQGEVVASRYAGTIGVPALFGSEHFAALGSLGGDRGAKGLLRMLGAEAATVAFERAAVDIDTPEDYEQLLSRRSQD